MKFWLAMWPLLHVIVLGLVPVLYGLLAISPGAAGSAGFVRARWLAGLAVALALLGWPWLALRGPQVFVGPTLLSHSPHGGLQLSLRSDVAGGALLLLVTFLGWVILRYSLSYLSGEPALRRYLRWLFATLCAVSLFILSNHLVLTLLSWIGVSLALHQLLLFYRERPQARLAAHKKFVLSRVAESLFLLAVVLIGRSLGSLQIDALINRVAQPGEVPAALPTAALLIAASVVIKCAQLPSHGWLMQVMEAPTPVSALLHAGVVNLGGFLLIRLSGLMAISPMAQGLLVVAGGLSAGLAALVTLTRTNIKSMLAWSTCAQLGFMLLECGLGAYDLALLHLLSHSLYKAHAFLRAGSTVTDWRQGQLLAPAAPPRLRSFLLAGALGVGVAYVAQWQAGPAPALTNPTLALTVLLGLSLTPLWLAAARRGAGWILGLGLAVLLLTGTLHRLGSRLSHASGVMPAHVVAPTWAAPVALALFVALFFMQALVRTRPQGRIAQALYPWFQAGLYLDDLLSRLLRPRPGRGSEADPSGLLRTNAATPRTTAVDGPISEDELQRAVDAACGRVAPSWPLDRFIAVNPYRGLGDRPMAQAAAELQLWAGSPLLPPRAYFRSAWQAGQLRREHLQAGVVAAAGDWTVDRLIQGLHDSPPSLSRLRSVGDFVDTRQTAPSLPSICDFVSEQISQFCAAWFDGGQASWSQPRQAGMYTTWRTLLAADHRPRLAFGWRQLGRLVQSLPDTPHALLTRAMAELGIPAGAAEPYLTSLLLRSSGWAAWCAYLRFEARKIGSDDDQIAQLLAIRLAWEWLLSQLAPLSPAERAAFSAQWSSYPAEVERIRRAQQEDWLWQMALERAYQDKLARGLLADRASPGPAVPTAAVQAVFCIDVRSEPLRRALEACSEQVQTRGFAGFFGLPIDYAELGTTLREPRLPGLLAPQLHAHALCPSPADTAKRVRQRRLSLAAAQTWRELRSTASSAFTLVESCGLLYGAKLLASSLRSPFPTRGQRPAAPGAVTPAVRPALPPSAALVDRVGQILGAMGLRSDFARVVLLCGHGSRSENNPHAAALQCGACGGQSGEINARLLAQLLNADWMRAALRQRDLNIPADTWFVAGVHDTTTDEVELFADPEPPASHTADLARLRGWLDQASATSRRRRAPSLDPAACSMPPVALLSALDGRACDWAQVRPEWGLADNASLIVAPRHRSRSLDLSGRVFLHDYDWRADDTLGTLELIMTAPMVVTHWINLQYYASTIDPVRFGAGNKVLHNVVGGHLGVLEGNGGDLRIGLPLQCLHDGAQPRHTPLRLSVFIEAPRTAISTIVARQPGIAALLDNDWLHLFQIDEAERTISRYQRGRWLPLYGVSAPPGRTEQAA